MESGGKVSEQGYIIALQYSSHEIERLETEIAIFEALLAALSKLEKNNMIVVESSTQVEFFKEYKGAVARLVNFRKNPRKRIRKKT